MKTLVLASSSPYRKQLLSQLQLPFNCISPDIDETPLVNETVQSMVTRLSQQKAQVVAAQASKQSVIISSDQVGVFQQQILTKPITHEKAFRQLQSIQGQCINFYTGLCVVDKAANNNYCLVESFDVQLKTLSDSAIERYLRTEKPYNCAGAFKSESYGITIIEKMIGSDPNTLVGLPLIALVKILNECGFKLP